MEDRKLLLAEILIKAHFGPVVQAVCSSLMHNGAQTLEEIHQKTNLSTDNVRESLLVGIQHNFLTYISRRRGAIYRILINLILERVRFPRFLQIGRERHKENVRYFLIITHKFREKWSSVK